MIDLPQNKGINISPIKVKALTAINDDVIVIDMNFDEQVTKSGIVLRSDNGKAHGIHPRWGKVYAVGPDQKDVKVGQWVLLEHGRWTRGIKIEDSSGVKIIRKVDVNAMLMVSDEEPSNDILIGDEA